MKKEHIINTLRNLPVEIGSVVFQVVSADDPYIMPLTVTNINIRRDGIVLLCQSQYGSKHIAPSRIGADIFKSIGAAEDKLAELQAKTPSAPTVFDISLIERPIDGSIMPTDVEHMLSELKSNAFQLITIEAKRHESFAMGFITEEAVARLGYDPEAEGLNDFIAEILDDMEHETENGVYRFQKLDIHLTR